MIEKSKLFDAKVGNLSKGCKECLVGNKTVLFVTGICPRHCYYCPISEEKWAKDDVYANEWKTKTEDEIIEEIKLCKSTGIGITGGDPLSRIDRTCRYIKRLKKEFKNFHTHLYTSLELVSEDTLKQLHEAGLDEIRVHPDLENNKLWDRIDLLKLFKWDKTVEIPVFPKKIEETKKLMIFCKGKMDFMNLNELELSHTNEEAMKKEGYYTKNPLSHGAKDSEEAAMVLLEFGKDFGYNIHYCSSKTKDVQMGKRISKRAKSIKMPGDIETDEGTLVRGIIYLKDLIPGEEYTKRINNLDQDKKQEYLRKLKTLKKDISTKLRVPVSHMHVDPFKCRIIAPLGVVEKNSEKIKELGLIPAFVEEYPTQDSLEVQVQFF